MQEGPGFAEVGFQSLVFPGDGRASRWGISLNVRGRKGGIAVWESRWNITHVIWGDGGGSDADLASAGCQFASFESRSILSDLLSGSFSTRSVLVSLK